MPMVRGLPSTVATIFVSLATVIMTFIGSDTMLLSITSLNRTSESSP